MLHQSPSPLLDPRRLGFHREETDHKVVDIGAIMRRYRWILIGCIGLFVVLAGLYMTFTTPLYTARAQIMIDPKMPQVPQREQGGELATAMDAALVESQMVVMRSEKIATAVISTLRLDEIPDPPFGPIAIVRSWLPWFFPPDSAAPTPFVRARRAIAAMEAGLSVRRIGTSYAFEISFSAPDAEKAAKIVNSIADAYVRDQLDSRSESAKQGSEWLEGRIQQLRRQMNYASRLVQEFRASHDYRIHGRKPAQAGATTSAEQIQQEPITLEELETAAQTARRIYESYLQAFAEAVQRQSFPLAGARVITAATRPLKPSHPRRVLILSLAVLLGGMTGVAIILVMQSRDTSIASVQQLRYHARTAAAVSVPSIRNMVAETRSTREMRRSEGSAYIEVAIAPLSIFSDELRRLKTFLAGADKARQPRLIGIVSACSGDGKSTIASNMAALFESSGSRTLLIDADLRHATLSRHLSPDAEHGLADVLRDAQPLQEVVRPTTIGGFDFLAATPRRPVAHSSDFLGSEQMRATLAAAIGAYDIVLVDLPPMRAVADALAVAPMLDGVVVVARSCDTRAEELDDLVSSLDGLRIKILASVLTEQQDWRPSRPTIFEGVHSFAQGWWATRAKQES